MTKLIVGLGNPGPRFSHTRHNVGFATIVLLGERHRVQARQRGQAIVGEGQIGETRVVLAQPTTMMNASGRAVGQLVRSLNLQNMSDLLVVYDDMDLPLGTVRIRAQGSAGGHNGLKSIIATIGTQDFARLRLGIGRPPAGEEPIEYVLARFRPDERPVLDEVLSTACDIVETWIDDGTESAMNRFNQWRAVAQLPPQ